MFVHFLGARIATLGENLETESLEVRNALNRASFDASNPAVMFYLTKMNKTLSEMAFVRTEILLAGERRLRRTMWVFDPGFKMNII